MFDETIVMLVLSENNWEDFSQCLTLHFNVSKVKDGGEQSANLPGVVVTEGEDLHRRAEVGVLLHVIPPLADGAVSLLVKSDG